MPNITAKEKRKSHDGDILSYVTLECIGLATGNYFVQLIPFLTTYSSTFLLTPLSH